MKNLVSLTLLLITFWLGSYQTRDRIELLPQYAEVNFADSLHPWDGFGINYVESAQRRSLEDVPEDYGGFSRLDETERQQIVEMIFGDDGLKPSIVKMFLDPFHEGMTENDNDNDNAFEINMAGFDHERTTRWMRYFVREGLGRTRKRDDDLQIITTLYGPPAWVTKQKFVRGRDLDPRMKYELGEYLLSWVKFLREKEKFPVKYLSLHNEGEARNRWPEDAKTGGTPDHDHNMHWPKEQVVDFLRFLPDMRSHFRLNDVGITPGETTNWKYFTIYGYSTEIGLDVNHAFKNLGLITSHSFGSASPAGVNQLRWVDRQYKTGRYLHTWITSTSWAKMDVDFIRNFYEDIYKVEANAIIPWACAQTEWIGGDPNPGTAFKIDSAGNYKTMPGYYYYKQACRAGQAGMNVVSVLSNDKSVTLLGFGAANTNHPDAFVLLNTSQETKKFYIHIKGSESKRFGAYRTSPNENYKAIGDFKVNQGRIQVEVPPRSVTTFYAAK